MNNDLFVRFRLAFSFVSVIFLPSEYTFYINDIVIHVTLLLST